MKKFTVTYYEHSVITVEIEAESAEDARIEFDNMAENGEIDFSDADVYDSELKIEEDETETA